MENKKILDKIRKCLALSKSPNEHEAAAALRQAQKLMRAHGLTDEDVQISDVNQKQSPGKSPYAPPRWQVRLGQVVAEAFLCHFFYTAGYGNVKVKWNFIGKGPAPEVAVYAFTVLLRKLTKARADYYKTNRRYKRANRIRRADIFAQMWVQAVQKKVDRFAESCPKTTEVINKYLDIHHPDLAPAKRKGVHIKTNDPRDLDAILDGLQAGNAIELQHSMNGKEQRRLA